MTLPTKVTTSCAPEVTLVAINWSSLLNEITVTTSHTYDTALVSCVRAKCMYQIIPTYLAVLISCCSSSSGCFSAREWINEAFGLSGYRINK